MRHNEPPPPYRKAACASWRACPRVSHGEHGSRRQSADCCARLLRLTEFELARALRPSWPSGLPKTSITLRGRYWTPSPMTRAPRRRQWSCPWPEPTRRSSREAARRGRDLHGHPIGHAVHHVQRGVAHQRAATPRLTSGQLPRPTSCRARMVAPPQPQGELSHLALRLSLNRRARSQQGGWSSRYVCMYTRSRQGTIKASGDTRSPCATASRRRCAARAPRACRGGPGRAPRARPRGACRWPALFLGGIFQEARDARPRTSRQSTWRAVGTTEHKLSSPSRLPAPFESLGP